jgi:hypothetical protein
MGTGLHSRMARSEPFRFTPMFFHLFPLLSREKNLHPSTRNFTANRREWVRQGLRFDAHGPALRLPGEAASWQSFGSARPSWTSLSRLAVEAFSFSCEMHSIAQTVGHERVPRGTLALQRQRSVPFRCGLERSHFLPVFAGNSVQVPHH